MSAEQFKGVDNEVRVEGKGKYGNLPFDPEALLNDPDGIRNLVAKAHAEYQASKGRTK